MTTVALTIISVVFVSLLSLLGIVFLMVSRTFFDRIVSTLIAFSSGTLLATAFLSLLPESLVVLPTQTSLLIITGMILFFLIERIINWHHCHGQEDCRAELPVGWLVLFGDGIHNFVDGAAIAAAFLVSPHLGFLTTIAVVAHEIPGELSDFAILIHAGFGKKKALLINLLSALTAVLGALFVLSISGLSAGFINVLLPITAGNFVYIAGTNLFPELHKRRSTVSVVTETLLIIAGVILVIFTNSFFEG